MSVKRSFEDTHENILQGALDVFAEKGYSAATIADISEKAGCNAVTVFRHFDDKLGLFMQVVERFNKLEFDEDYIQSRLTYTNIHADFTAMSGMFFDSLFQNIRILRVFINDGPNFEPLAKYLWYLPSPFKNFVSDYIQAVYPSAVSAADSAVISEMFVSYIVRTILRVNVQNGIDENSRQITREARETMALSVDMVMDLIMLHVKKHDSGRG